MRLEQAVMMEGLQRVEKMEPAPQRRTALEMAERVFEIAAQAGNPYQHITPKQWARRWLASREFVLAEVETDKVALLRTPRNQNQVLRNLQAQTESLEPLVVDLNKQSVKSPGTGYIPPVIAVDGAHRAYGQYLQGRDTVRAWVGTRALPKVKIQPLIRASAPVRQKFYTQHNKIAAAALLHAAQGLPQPPRQDTGDGGPSPMGGVATAMKSGAPGGSQYIRDRGVKAGGPGSGPHAGNGHDPRQFLPDRKEKTAYEHFDYDNKKGSFTCKEASCKQNSFTNVDDMYQHLKEKHGTVQAFGGGTGAAGSAGTGGAGGATSGANPNFIHSKGKKKVAAGGVGSGCRGPNCGRKAMGQAHEILKQAGFKNKGAEDIGRGTFAGYQSHYEHPDSGEKVTLSRGPVDSENFYSIKDKDGNRVASGHLVRNLGSLLQRYKKSAKERYDRIVDKHRNEGIPRGIDDVMRDAKRGKVEAARRTPEARSSGQLQQPDPSDTRVPPDPSDSGQATDPSDQLQYEEQPQTKPPGVRKGSYEQRGFQNPVSDAPGAGVGPRLNPDKGASQSDMQKKMNAGCNECGMKMDAAGKWVKKLVTDYKKAVKAGYRSKKTIEGSVPAGCEKMVKGLKKAGNVSNAWAVANWAHGQGRC